MRRITSGLLSLSFLCLLSISALANHTDLKEHITLNDKVYVNGTKVKPGRYTVRYNAESGDMTLSMNGKVVVQTKATVTTSAEKFDNDALILRDTANGAELTGIRLGGQHEEIHISRVTAGIDAFGFIFPDAILPGLNDGQVVTDNGYIITEDGYVVFEMNRL
jgi:hypothetical protein